MKRLVFMVVCICASISSSMQSSELSVHDTVSAVYKDISFGYQYSCTHVRQLVDSLYMCAHHMQVLNKDYYSSIMPELQQWYEDAVQALMYAVPAGTLLFRDYALDLYHVARHFQKFAHYYGDVETEVYWKQQRTDMLQKLV